MWFYAPPNFQPVAIDSLSPVQWIPLSVGFGPSKCATKTLKKPSREKIADKMEVKNSVAIDMVLTIDKL